MKINLPGGESNPGLPRDRRGYSPLYYRGIRLSKVGIVSFIVLSAGKNAILFFKLKSTTFD